MTNSELDAITIKADRQQRFRLYDDLREQASKTWLVQGIFGAAEASAGYGAPGSGKSVLFEDMGLHIAAGLDWHGRQVQVGAVVYVALERPQLVERRAMAFRKKTGLTGLPFAIVRGVMDFRDPKTAESVADICRDVREETGQGVVLVIIDTLSRALAGGDENSPKDMGAIVTATAHLQAKTGAHILWVHHMPHDGDRMRGHGALLGAMDTTMHVAKSGTGRAATVMKANDSEEGLCITFDLESVVIGEDGTTAPVVIQKQGSSSQSEMLTPALTKNQQTMLDLLLAAGSSGLTTEAWNAAARDIGIGNSRKADAYDLRSALKKKGMIREYGGRWNVIHE